MALALWLLPWGAILASAQCGEPGEAAGPTDEQGSSAPPPEPGGKQNACPRLESILFQLTQAADRAAFAASTGLDYQDGRVRVVVELEPDAELPPGIDLLVEARYLTLVQALALVDELCPLAAAPGVRAVSAPGRPEPASPRGG